MKDRIVITGKTKKSEYTIDLNTREVIHLGTKTLANDSEVVGENFTVEYFLGDGKTPFFSDMWCVLKGTPSDILNNIHECPFALVEEHCAHILEIVQNTEVDEVVYITFEGARPAMPNYFCRTKQYEAMRSCQKTMMASLYKIKRDKMILLPDYEL